MISPKPSSLKNASGRKALDYLKIFTDEPNIENQDFLNHYGTTLFREKGRSMDYSTKDLVTLKRQEFDRLDKNSISPDEKGLRRYLRLSRKGSYYRMDRDMKAGLFLMWVSDQPLQGSQQEQDFQDAVADAARYWNWMADNGYSVRRNLTLIRKHLGDSPSVASYLTFAVPRMELSSLSSMEKKVLNQVFSASKVYGKTIKYRVPN